ncbi:glycosyltransferase family 4 protein [Natronocalculus amylovorans]|uniref:Glycosyltransferase family 4 protein n=1 Tax=Natronocalculus amylovorans TaxID=2917812 RepID=A0AAE3K6U2_9EURY|nr:glycosyltransferase family 4 protein [Natronocalculus amylovorans]MCL9815353.1 glycosyltransferase family 4 protein [Natronocalculus amylovorans]NUE02132.1 glycosyltransferase family 4 protein [Halorubraceae archaeon YAN]
MRVTFVSMETPHRRDMPAIVRLSRLARTLAADGHEITICCTKWWEGEHKTFEQHDIEYRAVTDTPSTRSFAAKLPFVLRKCNSDVIHLLNSPPALVRAARAATTFRRTPIVVDWWSDVDGDSARSYEKAVRSSDRVVVPSRFIETMVREHGAAESTVQVIPEGVKMDLIREVEPKDGIDMVYSRRLDEHANVETFLLALAELRNRGWNAVVIGDGPTRQDAERTARDLRIDDKVRFVGDLPIRDRVSLFKGAHVFAQTAEFEPFASELLWALACGCVGIVEYQVGSSAHELVEGKSKLEGTRGRLVTSPQELAEEVVATRSLSRMKVDNAYDAYSYDTVVDDYLAVYESATQATGLF